MSNTTKKTFNKQGAWLIGAGALVLIVLAVILLSQTGAAGGTGTFTLVVSVDNGAQVLYDEALDIQEDQSLLDMVKEKVPEVVEERGLITSMSGVAQDEAAGKYWLYTVNGDFAMVGAGEYLPNDGDSIVFDLHAFEE